MKGHIRPRGKNTWALVIDIERDPITGKRRQKWIAVHGNKKEAERKLTEVLHEMNAGVYTEPAKITLGAFLDRWLGDYARVTVRATTLDSYRYLIERHISPALGHIQLANLKPLDLQRFYSEKLAGGRLDGRGGLSARSVRYIHGLLRESLGSAVKWQLIPRNVAEAVDPPRQVRPEMQVLDVDGVQAFLAAAKSTRFYALWLLGITTGLRRGELLGLRWQDVDLEAGAVVVRQTLICLRGKILVQPRAKTERSIRAVSLPETAVEALREHRERQTKERATFGEEYEDHDLVFCRPEGRPMDPNHLAARHFKPLLKQAGLPPIRIQDLRHTHATMLLGAGVNLKLVSDRLGHTTTRMTA
ncbi:MAG: site-specific integrase, partial [Firmicutes bacterium]|nr:site-specific integrase [Bacillota bacterium]